MRFLYESLFFILISFSSFGQAPNVNWLDFNRSSGRVLQIEARNINDFFVRSQTGVGSFGYSQISSVKNFETYAKEKINPRVNGSPATHEGFAIVANQLVVFMSDRLEGRNVFFAQVYNDQIEAIGDLIELVSFDLSTETGLFDRSFQLVQSANKQHLALVWMLPERREDQKKYGYRVFDSEFNMQQEGEIEVPLSSELSGDEQMYLTDTGAFFLVVKEFQQFEGKSLLWGKLDCRAIHIYQMNDYGLQDFEIDFDGKQALALSIHWDKEQHLIMSGTYADSTHYGREQVRGVFHIKLNYEKREILTYDFVKFNEALVTMDWAERKKRKLAKKRSSGTRIEYKLFNYAMRRDSIFDDGSVVGSMELYYEQFRSSMFVTTTDPYFNVIVAFKINPEGKFEWVKKVGEYQRPEEEYGFFNSYERYLSEGKIGFFYNDNRNNYDEQGNFVNVHDLHPKRPFGQRTLLSFVEIDLETGEFNRKSGLDYPERRMLAVPKLFYVDDISGEVLMYAVNRAQEAFGVFRFGQE